MALAQLGPASVIRVRTSKTPVPIAFLPEVNFYEVLAEKLNWGGDKQLCTRETKFETNEQADCGARGFAATGFGVVDMSSGGKTLRFALP